MKKIVFGILICLFIVSCGKDYKTYTKKEKEEMYNIALEELEKGNSKEMDQIDELMEKLEIAYKNGDETAKIEWKEWYAESIRYRSNTSKLLNSKVDMTNRAW